MKLFISFICLSENNEPSFSNTILHAEDFDLSALDLDQIRSIEEKIAENINAKTVRIINYKVI